MGTNRIEAIVMGGSSGALEALSTLLPALPSDCAIPVAIVVHLPPARPSHLAEVLGVRTVLPVREAEDKDPIAAGTVYVAPPDYHLLVERSKTFALSADEAVLFSRPSIDVLFESAADAYGGHLAGIVLTGASADGARGLSAVKQRGGMAIVQSPKGAVAPAMPRAALSMVQADHVLSLTDLASLLGRLTRGDKESR
jgi:two-component system, chemotaxis family, protein-glutamate methylesterase/glutaminase